MKTLKDLLKEANKDSVLYKCLEIQFESYAKSPSDEEKLKAYSAYERVYNKLISFGEWTWFRKKYKLFFHYTDDILLSGCGDSEKYIDICLLNLNFEPFDESLKPWGGKSDDKNDAPDGYFNINYKNHSKYYSMSFMPWRIIVNLEVEIDDSICEHGISMDTLLAEALYELTFEGFTESSYLETKNEIKRRIDNESEEEFLDADDVIKDIKDYMEDRSPTEQINKNGSFKIKISKTAVEDIKKFFTEES